MRAMLSNDTSFHPSGSEAGEQDFLRVMGKRGEERDKRVGKLRERLLQEDRV